VQAGERNRGCSSGRTSPDVIARKRRKKSPHKKGELKERDENWLWPAK